MKGLILIEDNLEEYIKKGKTPKGIKLLLKIFKKNNIETDLVNYKNIKFDLNQNNLKFTINNKISLNPDFVLSIIVPEPENPDYYNIKKCFEYLNIKVINPIDNVNLARNKFLTLVKIKNHLSNINVPKTMEIRNFEDSKNIIHELGLPLVIKLNNGYGGEGISLINNEMELIQELKSISLKEESYIAQEAIMTSTGRDVRIVILNNQFFYSFERYNQNDFRSNKHQGGRFKDYTPSKDLINLAIDISKILGLDYCGIDFLFGESDTFYLCEVNTFPGFSYILKKYDEEDTSFLDKIYYLFNYF
ncbi:RimK family alpha-L-glutamate ligase [Methanobrevibacter acididurans]|uniref:ATP-grasp domain-containing protein n=1 Tax=Methanobrevibacter acididurans TaxID=120963 RepID=UPI0038FC9955